MGSYIVSEQNLLHNPTELSAAVAMTTSPEHAVTVTLYSVNGTRSSTTSEVSDVLSRSKRGNGMATM